MKTRTPPETDTPPWVPQSGPQQDFVDSDVFEVVYGGARGGGKTDAALGEFALHAEKHGEGARGLLVRRTRVALEPTIARARQIFAGAQWAEQKSRFTWPNGARLSFRHLDNDSHADAYQGHDYSRVYIEELHAIGLREDGAELLQPQAMVAWPDGAVIVVRNAGAGVLTIQRGAGVILLPAGTNTDKDCTVAPYGLATLIHDYPNDSWTISGVGVS